MSHNTVRYEATCGGQTVISTHYLYNILFGTQTAYTKAGALATNDDTKVDIKDGVHYGVDAITFNGLVLNPDGTFTEQPMTSVSIICDMATTVDPDDPLGMNTLGKIGTINLGGVDYELDLNGDVSNAINVVGNPTSCDLSVAGSAIGDTVSIPLSTEALGSITASDAGVSSLYGFADMSLDVTPITIGGADYFRATIGNDSEAMAGTALKVYRDGVEVYSHSVDPFNFESGAALNIPLAVLAGSGYETLRFAIESDVYTIDGTTANIDVTAGNNEFIYNNPNMVYVALTYDGDGSVEGGGCYAKGTEGVIIRAVAGIGERFVEWLSSTGETLSTSPEYILPPLTGDMLINAVFTGGPVPTPTENGDITSEAPYDPTPLNYGFVGDPSGTLNDDGSISFTINNNGAWLMAVDVDTTRLIQGEDYKVTTDGGNITITLTKECLAKFAPGEHMLTVSFSEGYYSLTHFTIAGAAATSESDVVVAYPSEIPQTGDNDSPMFTVALMALGFVGMAVFALIRRRNRD